MSTKNVLAALTLMVAASYAINGQVVQSDNTTLTDATATPAYEVLVLRKVTVETDLSDLQSRVTSDSPTFKAKSFELMTITREIERLQTLEKPALPKLTTTYGNLILRKVTLAVQLNDLRTKVTPESPDFKRTRTELAILERELDNLLK
jgi:uncharacterized protein involved in exopolysaccharide biosynthesis